MTNPALTARLFAPEAVQQQQQPHVEKGSDETKSSPSTPKRA